MMIRQQQVQKTQSLMYSKVLQACYLALWCAYTRCFLAITTMCYSRMPSGLDCVVLWQYSNCRGHRALVYFGPHLSPLGSVHTDLNGASVRNMIVVVCSPRSRPAGCNVPSAKERPSWAQNFRLGCPGGQRPTAHSPLYTPSEVARLLQLTFLW